MSLSLLPMMASTSDQSDGSEMIAIDDYEELKKIGDPSYSTEYPLDGGYELSGDITADGEDTFTPIGTMDGAFSGTIDGKGHTISGLNVEVRSTDSDTYAGLIGYAEGNVTIKDLTLTDCRINSISGEFAYAGGLIGELRFEDQNVLISNCHCNCEITADGTATKESYSHAGGLIGSIRQFGGSLTITDCYNEGNIKASSSSPGGSVSTFAGGMAGHINPSDGAVVSIENCYNTGKIESDISLTVELPMGDVKTYVGGIAGYAHPFFKDSKVTLTDCYNAGEISAISDATDSKSVSIIVGGLVGHAAHDTSSDFIVSDCYNVGAITAETSNTAAGDQMIEVGGLIGQAFSVQSGALLIKNCYDAGIISAATSTDPTTNVLSGGLMGTLEGDDITPDIIVESYYLDSLNQSSLVGNQDDASLTSDASGKITSDAMADKATFTAWDFDNVPVWSIQPYFNSGYPVLEKLIDSYVEETPDEPGDEPTETTYYLKVVTGDGGTTRPSPNTMEITQGESLVIQIIPDNGYEIEDVKVNGISNYKAIESGRLAVNMTSDMLVEITFSKDFYLNVYAQGGEGGVVTGSGEYSEGDTVTVYADPNEGYTFEKWSDGNTEQLRSVLMAGDMSLAAIFTEDSVGGGHISDSILMLLFLIFLVIFCVGAIAAWRIHRNKKKQSH